MGLLPEGYDIKKEAENFGRPDPVPNGFYVVNITNHENKPTKKQDGFYDQLDMQIIEGDHKGRKLFARLNLKNNSQQAVAIARQELSAIIAATIKKNPQSFDQLKGIQFAIEVVVKGEYNEIKSYMSIEEYRNSDNDSTSSDSDEGDETPW